MLVPGDEFHASLALVRALAAGGYLPLLAVTLAGTYASRSRAVSAVRHVPHAEDQPAVFVGEMARAARELRADAVLPGTEASLIALAERREEMPCPLGAPATEIVELATNKARVVALARECGFDAPPSIVAKPTELIVRAEDLRYPAILKPLRTRIELDGSRLAYYRALRLGGPHELRAALEDLPDVEWAIQPYLDGHLSAVAGVAWEGQLLGAVHQVSRRIWPPDVGYSCYAVTVPPDRELESRLASLLARIGWSGIFQAQLLGDGGGQRFLIDFNPRAYGSLSLAVRAGANLPAVWASLVIGLSPPRISYRPGVHYRLEHNDVLAILRKLREGQITSALAALVPRPRTAHAVFSIRDLGPLITTAEKFLALRSHG